MHHKEEKKKKKVKNSPLRRSTASSMTNETTGEIFPLEIFPRRHMMQHNYMLCVRAIHKQRDGEEKCRERTEKKIKR
jgi:hypothetical protein